jgi:Amt family ammonium transporter
MGAIIYPVAGNWVWGGGWLSFLGLSLQLGHGFIDFGGGGSIFLLGATVALVGLRLFPAPISSSNEAPPPADLSPNEAALSDSPAMPSAYLPILSMLGGGLLLLGWLGGLVGGDHTPLAIDFSPVHAAVAGALAAFGGALAAAGYSWGTTRAANPLMTTRGLVAGLGVTLAGAPFLSLAGAIGAGLAMGALLPVLIYWFDHKLPLRDSLGVAATFGASGLIGLLLIPLLADGRAGQGWHQVEGAIGAGVPGQWQAQLAGIGVIILWGVITGGTTLFLLKAIASQPGNK